MTVKQLIKKLEKMPQDATVVVYNDSTFFDGVYKATGIESYKDGEVAVTTNHKTLLEEW